MLNSGIEYIDHSWNPWIGCRKVSDGCLHCYMHREMARFGKDPADIHRTSKATWNQARKFAPGSTVFVCTWSDFFIEEADPWRDDAWAMIQSRPLAVKWLIVTKRPERIKGRLPWGKNTPWPNVVGIVTAENQEMADLRIPILLRENFAIRGVSVEPMLDEIDLERGGWSYLRPLIPPPGNKGGWKYGLDWVICGTESGPNRRPAKIEWIMSLRDQCAGIPFFLKQMEVDGKVMKTPRLDGRQWTERPW
jgi:protein gp37